MTIIDGFCVFYKDICWEKFLKKYVLDQNEINRSLIFESCLYIMEQRKTKWGIL